MKQYLLLRSNEATGPYSIQELKDLKLAPLDLVWKEGQSTRWAYPGELDELKEAITLQATKPGTATTQKHLPDHPGIYVAMPANTPQREITPQYSTLTEDETLETKFEQPLKEIKELYVRQLQEKKFRFQANGSYFQGFSVVGVIAAVLIGAVMMKNIVDGSGKDYTLTGETSAVAIPLESALPEAEALPAPAPEKAVNAVAVDTVETTLPEKKTKPANLKKQVQLKANAYQTGVFGGIEGLELTVHNKSGHLIDKVLVQVQYLKPNGEVVRTEDHEIFGVPAKGKKTLAIPDNKRGVKVNYKIISVESKQYKSALLHA